MKYTKKARDRDEIQLKMLELLSNDPMAGPSNVKEDYLDMHFASITDRMRKRMTVDQQDDLVLEIDQVVNDAFCQIRRGTATATSTTSRNEMTDVTMGVRPMGNNPMSQQFPGGNNLQSSNDMFGPAALNQAHFQGFPSYMQLN